MNDRLFDRVIDIEAAYRSLERFLCGGDDVQTTFVAAALVHLDCGHVRPMNCRFESGEELACVLCGPATVTALELIDPTEFPTVDSLARLNDGAV